MKNKLSFFRSFLNLSISQSFNLSISQSPNLSISQSLNLSISQSLNLPISQSPNLSISQLSNLISLIHYTVLLFFVLIFINVSPESSIVLFRTWHSNNLTKPLNHYTNLNLKDFIRGSICLVVC